MEDQTGHLWSCTCVWNLRFENELPKFYFQVLVHSNPLGSIDQRKGGGGGGGGHKTSNPKSQNLDSKISNLKHGQSWPHWSSIISTPWSWMYYYSRSKNNRDRWWFSKMILHYTLSPYSSTDHKIWWLIDFEVLSWSEILKHFEVLSWSGIFQHFFWYGCLASNGGKYFSPISIFRAAFLKVALIISQRFLWN